ncbi:ABC transporter transmembrane domain-containing protein [Rubripirellula reticaptiva]|uniref:Putative multidrug export ATP-binding/permease protein n=1 Tax=Rubripirellula reticaptiva TaxID=2528013 RepID=A0A5C6F5R0_9BACT|nr:ABC transporter ATP-binding protein [Rubripirellula reticaptiva]TWU55890.1 putative multidrug export ATP-binding/permease protein [Rubripirellula reticaptiva]
MPDFNDQTTPSEGTLFRVLTRVGISLGTTIQRADWWAAETSAGDRGYDPLDSLIASAKHAGILLNETTFESASEVFGFLREEIPILICNADGSFSVLEKLSGRRIQASLVGDRTESRTYTNRQLRKLLIATPGPRCFSCKRELQCDSISAADGHHAHDGHHHHAHPSPLRRFIGLLNLDRRDIWSVVLFAFVAGLLSLASPLAIESLVNVVSWGTYLQPLIVLGLMLLACLGLAGVLKVLQTVVVEMIQRRQFVRIVSDLAHRFPRANQASLVGEYPRELANRVFDIMTIQKATAVLLLDGVTIVLTTLLGMILLAFYHPFLLGFDIVLLISMISITWVLGRGGIRTSIEESITKYRVVHWLQDVIASPSIFKTGGGETLAIQRANQLSADYIRARQGQFRVVIRQVTFAVALQVLASTAVLALGGWLVISGQLTLGQLVASELVVTVVVGAFAKAGKSLEKFYDLMAGIDKVGHLIDIQVDPRHELTDLAVGPAEVSWTDLVFSENSSKSKVPSSAIEAGTRVALVGDDVTGRQRLSRTLAGLLEPTSGTAQIAGLDAASFATGDASRLIGYAGRNDIFHGTLRENVDLGHSGIGQSRILEALKQVGLDKAVLQLPDGIQTRLQTGGYPLTEIHAKQLSLVRAIVAAPKLLIVDGLLDELSSEDRQLVWQAIAATDVPWTLIINTNRDDVAKLCDVQIAVRR